LFQDQLHGKTFRYLAVDGAQELQELLVPVPRQALLDHHPGEHTFSAPNSLVVPCRR
jgi:hypothetical protein